jgi:ABC-type transporter MlaC component
MRIVFAIAALALSVTSAAASPDAERFTAMLVGQGTNILHDNNDASRSARLHQLIMQNVDARKTALFALGNYQRGLPSQALETYVAAFTDYITTIYESRFKKYRDLDIRVLSSLDNGPNDSVVLTQGRPSNERSMRDPIIIGFHLLGGNGYYKIVDVQVAGIWVSINQREQFADMMSRSNSDIRALIGYLTEVTAQIRSGIKRV